MDCKNDWKAVYLILNEGGYSLSVRSIYISTYQSEHSVQYVFLPYFHPKTYVSRQTCVSKPKTLFPRKTFENSGVK